MVDRGKLNTLNSTDLKRQSYIIAKLFQLFKLIKINLSLLLFTWYKYCAIFPSQFPTFIYIVKLHFVVKFIALFKYL